MSELFGRYYRVLSGRVAEEDCGVLVSSPFDAELPGLPGLESPVEHPSADAPEAETESLSPLAE